MQSSATPADHLLPFLDLRAAAYDLLRRTFLEEPSPDYITLISAPGYLDSFPFAGVQLEICQGIAATTAYLRQQGAPSGTCRDALHGEFTRLFIGPDRLPAPPWESAYQAEGRLLLQEPVLQVRAAYSRYQFTAKDSWQKIDDHLGLELDFMFQLSCLCREQRQNSNRLDAVLRDSQTFLTQHLLSWVPELCRDIGASDRTGFYRGMAWILKGFLTVDQVAVAEILAAQVPSVQETPR